MILDLCINIIENYKNIIVVLILLCLWFYDFFLNLNYNFFNYDNVYLFM